MNAADTVPAAAPTVEPFTGTRQGCIVRNRVRDAQHEAKRLALEPIYWRAFDKRANNTKTGPAAYNPVDADIQATATTRSRWAHASSRVRPSSGRFGVERRFPETESTPKMIVPAVDGKGAGRRPCGNPKTVPHWVFGTLTGSTIVGAYMRGHNSNPSPASYDVVKALNVASSTKRMPRCSFGTSQRFPGEDPIKVPKRPQTARAAGKGSGSAPATGRSRQAQII